MDNSVPDFSRFSNNDMLRFCNVKFSEDGPQYTYYCGDSDIAVGDEVIVPVWGDSIKSYIIV